MEHSALSSGGRAGPVGWRLWSTPTSRATKSNRLAMVQITACLSWTQSAGRLLRVRVQGEVPRFLPVRPASGDTGRYQRSKRRSNPPGVIEVERRTLDSRRGIGRMLSGRARSRDTSCEPQMLYDKPGAPLHRVAWHIDDRVTQVAIDFADSLPERLCRFEGHPSVAVGDIDLRPRR